MKYWTQTFWKASICLLLTSFSLGSHVWAQDLDSAAILVPKELAAGDTAKSEREGRLALAQACFGSERWEEAEAHFCACTDNQFAKGLIHDLMEENARIRPRHVKGAIFLSRIIPGMAYWYVGEPGKALANFALMGGLAVGFVYAWPIAAQFGAFFAFDWVTQGSKHAEQIILAATQGKRTAILQQILKLANE